MAAGLEGRKISPHSQFADRLPGDYFRYMGIWYGVAPNGLLANLGGHEVLEEEDGSISVKPSIKVSNGTDTWHGYLTKGVWTEC